MAEETISQETAAFDWDALSLDGYTKAERSELSENECGYRANGYSNPFA